MKKALYSFLVLFIGFSTSAKGQIFEKLVKKVAKEVVKEVTSTEDNQGEVHSGKTTEVVLPSEKAESLEINTEGSQAAAGAENFFKEKTSKEVLGPLGEFILFSPDKRYVAHSKLEGSRQVMLVNGKPGPVLDDVNTHSFKFSPEGGHYAYVGKKNGECTLFRNGKEEDKVLCSNGLRWARDLFFNQDGSVLAYYKELENRASQVMINGSPGPESSHNSFQGLSIRGNNVFYSGRGSDITTRSGIYLYRNHKPELETPVNTGFFVSNDGETHAYLSVENNKKHAVINGKKLPNTTFLFMDMDPETGAVFCTGGENNQMIWKGKTFTLPAGDKLGKFSVMSPDGSRIAYMSSNDSGQRLWVDGKPGPYFKEIPEVQFTGDGQKIIYIVSSGGKNFVVVNEETLGPFEKVTDLQVSETGNAYTFVVKNGSAYHRYLNGKDLGDLGDVQNFTFSPDGSRYAALIYGEKAILLDGKKQSFPDFQSLDNFEGDPDDSGPRFFIFSPKGNRLAITYKRAVKNSNEAVLLLDDQKYISDRNNGGHAYPTFSEDGVHFAFLTKVKGEGEKYYWQLYIDMKPGPIVGGMKNPITSPPQNISLKFLDNNNVQTIGVLDQEIVKHTVTL